MKRLITLLVILSFIFTIPVLAASPALSLTCSEVGEVGGELTITVNLSGSPGICGCAFVIGYDSRFLKPVSFTGGSGFKGYRSGNLLAKDAQGKSVISYSLISGGKISADGEVASFTFSVLDAPHSGWTTLTLEKYSNNPFLINSNANAILTTVTGCSAELTGGTEEPEPSVSPVPEPVVDAAPQPEPSPEIPENPEPELEPAALPDFVVENEGDFIIDDYTAGEAEMPDPEELDRYMDEDSNEEAKAEVLQLMVDLQQNAGGYISGYPDGTFHPDATITRAETAVIFGRLSRQEGVWESAFSDVPQGKWYSAAVCLASSKGVITGYPDGTFHPDATITRGEFCTVLARFMAYDQEGRDFSDTAGHWASSFITACREAGVTGGYSDGTFCPDAPITRAEAVAMINRAMNVSQISGVSRFVDVTADHWAYGDIIAAAN